MSEPPSLDYQGLPSDVVGGDEQITAAVEADIERNTAHLLRDYPLASITPIIDGLKHFPPPTAHPVRSWPSKAAPSPLPAFTVDNAEGFALMDKPLDSMSQEERGYVGRNLENAAAVMRQTLMQQPIADLRFKDVPRYVPASTAVPNIRLTDRAPTAIDNLMESVPIPMPSPASGRAIAGQPVASTSRELLEAIIHSASLEQPHINGHATPANVTPISPHKRRFSDMNGSPSQPNFYVDVSPKNLKKRATVDSMHVDEPMEAATPVSSQPAVVNDQGQIAVAKLSTFLEDVFEAEDTFSPEDSRVHPTLNAAIYLSASSLSDNEPPLLSPIAIRHALKLVRQVVKLHVLLEIKTDDLSRLLKIIERGIRRGEDIEAIPGHLKVRSTMIVGTPSKGKGGRSSKASTPARTPAKRPARARKARAKSSSPAVGDGEDELDELAEAPDDLEDFRPEQESQKSRKSQQTSRSAGSRSPSIARVQADLPEEKPTVWTDEALVRFEGDLRMVSEALLSSELALAILSGATLPKQLYAEELISSIVVVVKTQLESLVYPCIEATADIEDGRASHLAHPLRVATSKALLNDVFRTVADVLPLATEVMRLEDMSESIIVPIVMIAIGPFFVDTSTQWATSAKKGRGKELSGATTLKTIQLPALSLLRNVFAKYPDQRPWIVEEVVNSLTKLSDVKKAKRQFRLRNGAAIHNVSALLLHLVQSTAHGVEDSVRKQLIRDEPEDASQNPDAASLRIMAKSRNAVKASIESASVVANSLIKLLLERSKTAAKSSSEADYRAVFENLVADVLIVADLAEWPVANFMLHVCLRRMFSAMDSKQASPEASALKALAVEHLGNIGSKLSERAALAQSRDAAPLQPLNKILRSADEGELRRLIGAQEAVISQLQEWTTEDAVSETAAQFIAARWASDLIRAIDRITLETETPSDDREEATPALNGVTCDRLQTQLDSALRAVFAEKRERLFIDQAIEDDDDPASLQNLSLSLAWAQGQAEMFETLLKRILDVLQTSEAAGQRSKCLKALGKVVEKDPSIFARDDVRQAIEQRFRDTQPSVRDAAFDLLGAYVVHDADLASKYLPRIADRITDTGLSVRKRVIKLLKSIYGLLPEEQQRVEICRRLLSRVKDDDDAIKDLALVAVEEMWFTKFGTPRKPGSKPKRGSDSEDEEKPVTSADKHSVLTRSKVLISLSASMRDRGSQMEEMLKMILDKHAETPKALLPLRARLRDIVEALADVLVEAAPDTDFDKVNCAKALGIFVAADPTALSVQKADTLLPYLQVGAMASGDDHAVREHLLRIFHLALPAMPNSALPLASKLETILFTMLKRPPMQQSALEELVGSLCAAVKHHTQSYDKLAGIFKQFLGALRSLATLADSQASAATAKATAEKLIISSEKEERALMTANLLGRVVALICEHADFDAVRSTSESAAPAIDTISTDPIAPLIFDWLMSLYLQDTIAELRSNAMLCLGFLFRSYPSMMLEPAATKMMDDIFSQSVGGIEEQTRLLGVIRDFLTQQAAKHTDLAQSLSTSKKPKAIEIDMKELIGNTDTFADSGVSSAIVQRYLSHILQAALSVEAQTKVPAVDILGFTVRQGLAHPLESLRVIVALETGPDLSIAKRMAALHSTLHTKHADLVHARFLDCARASFDYLSKLNTRQTVRGYRSSPVTALFEAWYGLLREKRKWKLDFIKAMLRAFAIDPGSGRCSQEEVDFGRYVAENLAALEYKTTEEVYACLTGLDRILGETGTATGHLIEERLDTAAAMGEAVREGGGDGGESASKAEGSFASLVRASQLLSIALMLRDHLKTLYRITEAKLSKYTPGKKSPAGDKAAVRHDDVSVALSYDTLPLAVRALVADSEEMAQQARQWTEAIGAETSGAVDDDNDD